MSHSGTAYRHYRFQGEELSALLESILNVGSSGYAILFLDEFDKILAPLISANHDNFNGVLQHELLAFIEGKEYQIKQRGIIYTVGTRKILFIAMGTFTDYRHWKKSKKPLSPISFLSQLDAPIVKQDILIHMDEPLVVGGKTELLGRFDSIYNFQPIKENAFRQLFDSLLLNLGIE